MKTNIFVILFLLFSLAVHAQSNRRLLHGKIVNDSLSVEKIHVINKNTNKGTLSNQYGDFVIPVKVGDTLVFSAIQFDIYKHIISEVDLQQLQLILKLKSKTNELDEVIVKFVSISEGMNLPNADKKPLNRIENRLNAHNKSSAPIVALATLLNQRGGIDNLYYLLSGKRKRDRKLNKLMLQDEIASKNAQLIENIRQQLTDDFFTNTADIPVKKINDFIDFCLKDDIETLYNENRILELIELFLQKSNAYLEQIKE